MGRSRGTPPGIRGKSFVLGVTQSSPGSDSSGMEHNRTALPPSNGSRSLKVSSFDYSVRPPFSEVRRAPFNTPSWSLCLGNDTIGHLTSAISKSSLEDWISTALTRTIRLPWHAKACPPAAARFGSPRAQHAWQSAETGPQPILNPASPSRADTSRSVLHSSVTTASCALVSSLGNSGAPPADSPAPHIFRPPVGLVEYSTFHSSTGKWNLFVNEKYEKEVQIWVFSFNGNSWNHGRRSYPKGSSHGNPIIK